MPLYRAGQEQQRTLDTGKQRQRHRIGARHLRALLRERRRLARTAIKTPVTRLY